MHTAKKIRTIKAPAVPSRLDTAKIDEAFRRLREERGGRLMSIQEAEKVIRNSKVGIVIGGATPAHGRARPRTSTPRSSSKKK